MRILTTISIILLLNLPIQAQDWDSVEIKTVKVTDNISMLQGRGGNIGVITGDDGIMIVDNQYAPLADKIKAAIKGLSDKKINYVVNTHWHGDHMGGNEAFGSDGSIIIAHENVRKRISTDQFMAFQKREVASSPEIAWPIVTFTESITFFFNDEEIAILHGPPAHTDGDAVVYFKTSNVIHMGDTFVTYGYPFIDVSAGGSINGMIDHLNNVLAMIDDDTKVIPGHGDLSNKGDIRTFVKVLTTIRDDVNQMVNDGKSLDDILSSGLTKNYDEEWNGTFITAKDFLNFIYSDLADD